MIILHNTNHTRRCRPSPGKKLRQGVKYEEKCDEKPEQNTEHPVCLADLKQQDDRHYQSSVVGMTLDTAPWETCLLLQWTWEAGADQQSEHFNDVIN